ncbi:hypothetical protein [Actinokineospora sp. HUAS TT18]|uniref:hypothetical protein n=1 Tax=Actinokineospora sp. HUAS TT18 TaxID=3447451 RepID=UPI003F52120F
MSETELREGLRLALADEPPLFDVDSVVDRARTAVARRRAAMMFGAAGAVVAILVAVLPMLAGAMPEGPVVAAFPAPSETVRIPADDGAIVVSRIRTELPAATDFSVVTPAQVEGSRRVSVRFVLGKAPVEIAVEVRAPCDASTRTCAQATLQLPDVDQQSAGLRQIMAARSDSGHVLVSAVLPDSVGVSLLSAISADPALTY